MKDSIIEEVMLSKEIRPLQNKEELKAFIMKEKDAEEALASTGAESVREALNNCVELSEAVWIIQKPTSPIGGVFGLAPTDKPEYGVPWLLGTPFAKLINPIKFARLSKKIIKKFQERYKVLFNYVSADYYESIRWLQFLGFKVSDQETYLKDPDVPFKLFWRCR